jgi:hypothetical protein
MTFNEYLEGISPDDIVPAVSGSIVKITDPCEDNKNIQTLVIADEDENEISVKLKPAVHLAHPSLGDVLHAASGKKGTVGLTLKKFKSGSLYISADKGAVISSQPAGTTTGIEDEEEEPLTGTEVKIESLIRDRFYVFEFCKKTREKYCPSFPEEKLPELATSMHIEFMRAGIPIRPSQEQEKRKTVHKERSEKKQQASEPSKPTKPEADTDEWKLAKHPANGAPLGGESVEKIATVLWPWAIRQISIGGASTHTEYARAVLDAAKAYKLTPPEILDAYVVKYALDYEKHSEKRRNAAIERFYSYIEGEYYYSKNKDGVVVDLLSSRKFVKAWDAAQDQ